MTPREWNAASYDSLPLPHVEWGLRTIDRLALTGDERVLDAGCGTGRDAAEVLARYPAINLVGIDGSVTMIEQATRRLAPFADRVRLRLGDLTEPIDVSPNPAVDAVLSVACFHWIDDQRTLFDNLFAVLAPGGRLVSDCGGEGNIDNVHQALIAVEGVAADQTTFATVAETEANLTAAGFVDVQVGLRPHPVRIEDPVVLAEYLATVCLGSMLAQRPAAEHDAFVAAVRQAMPEPVLDYQRLEIDARRP